MIGTCIITGASGLIGSQCVEFMIAKGMQVVGIDNDMRSYFFGPDASTKPVGSALTEKHGKKYIHYNVDIRDEKKINDIFKTHIADLVIHTAAQPSHDWAAKEPLTDFSINATGTMILLEACRNHSPESVFIFTSTNKVYGDLPNFLNLIEEESRYEHYTDTGKLGTIDENMSIDNSKHSIFGASKVAADVMVQEYGKYFGMKTGIFRGGCLTGPNHQGAELHGFLSYLVKCIVHDKTYTIFGYKGKQVRDNIHSYDLVSMFWNFYENPLPGEVYNAGGGRPNSISILEAIEKTKKLCNSDWNKYSISEKNRIGDHKWYISDLSKFKTHYPSWEIKHTVDDILLQIVTEEIKKR